MKMFAAAATLACSIAQAAPQYSNCISDDSKLRIELSNSKDSEMIDLKIVSMNTDRPAEGVFPTRENLTPELAVYTLLDSEFELLSVDRATGKGKLSNTRFGTPKPFIDVSCK